ncbi:MAG: protocatechuate 3,4-dioxygenase subunit alpha [Pseudomonadota bacterium]
MAQKLRYLRQTASQTAGPFVHIGLAPATAGFEIYHSQLGQDITGPHASGERIRVEGTITDGIGNLVKDALIEVWQANAEGHYAHPDDGGPIEDGFQGWGRAVTDFETGLWRFDTLKPGGCDGQAPHLNLWIIARGINTGLSTRMYFEDESDANASDPVLNMIEGEPRRQTLFARRSETDGIPVYRFDIRLQGENETVFFDI